MTVSARLRQWLPLALPLALLSVAYWLNQQVLPEPISSNTVVQHDPDAIVENFSATTLSAQGTPRFVMSAKKLRHYPDDDSTTLDEPKISLFSENKPTIFIKSKLGILARKGDEVFLHNNVKLAREASARNSELAIETEYLHVIPNKQIVNTDRAVTITNAQTTLHAVGMELDNNARTTVLLSEVRSEYVPNNY